MNFEQILSAITTALKNEIGEDLTSIQNFIDSQGNLISQQALWIAESRAYGTLKNNDDLFNYFTGALKRDTIGLAQSVAMHSIITIEKAWNAIANVVWGSIRTILTGAGIPANLLPETPPLSR